MAKLAHRLHDLTGWGRCFFANSGTEANECAFKLVRKWAGLGRYKIVAARPSFHGRTMMSLAATGQPSKWEGFEPLPEGFLHAPFNDIAGFAAAVDAETAGIIVEPVLGESGVIPATADFLRGLRALCDEYDLALIFDEVQTGVGRTGTFWAFQGYGVEPDVFTSAKALANGLPIGVCIANERLAGGFGPGDHGSTFGGNPVSCAAALATLDVIENESVLARVPGLGETLSKGLGALPHVQAVRGQGLLVAAVLDEPVAADVVRAALANGLVINNPSPDVLRFAPPLTVTDDEIAEALGRLATALHKVARNGAAVNAVNADNAANAVNAGAGVGAPGVRKGAG